MLRVFDQYCILMKVLRSCLHKIYGLNQVYTTALKDKLSILYTNMLTAQEMVTRPKQWLINFVNYKKIFNHYSLIYSEPSQYQFLVLSGKILMGRTVMVYSYASRSP